MTVNHDIPEIPLRGADFLDDRGAYWRRIRDLGRLVRDSSVPDSTVYYVTRRDDVLAALRDPESFKPDVASFHVTMPDGQHLDRVPQSMSPTDHARVARALHAAFTPKALAPFGEEIRAQARSLIADVAGTGRCDAVRDDTVHWFGHGALLTVCGIELQQWLPKVYPLMRNRPADGDEASAQTQLLQYLGAGLAAGYRRRPGILWELIDAVDAGGSSALSTAEFFGFVLLLRSGSQNVIIAIQYALLRLARDAQLQRCLRQNPALIDTFIEEIVRLDSGAVPYITKREVTIGDCTIAPQTRIGLCLESASREDSGDELSVTSKRRRHWGFGGGIHRCLGAHLARLEAKICIEEWLQAIPEFELEPGVQPDVDGANAAVTALPLRWAIK